MKALAMVKVLVRDVHIMANGTDTGQVSCIKSMDLKAVTVMNVLKKSQEKIMNVFTGGM